MAELAAMRQAKEQLKRRVEGTTGELAQSKLRVRELEAECARLREEVCHSVRMAMGGGLLMHFCVFRNALDTLGGGGGQ